MSSSFQSTAATNIYDSPVDTFVNPVTVLPKTGMMELADTLKTINPALQTYLGGVLQKEKEKGILQGEIDVLMASPEKLKKFTNALKSSNKKEARQILGNNIFVRAGIEKRLAINNGLAIEGKLNEFLNNKTITVEGTNGTTRQVPLKEFSVNSEEFKRAISEFSETRKQDVTGIRSSFINQYFMPEVAKSVSKAYINQEKNNREFVTEQTNTTLKDNILANFSTIDFSNFDEIDFSNPDSFINIAIENMQEEIDYLDAIGAINSVSPTAMKNNVMEIAETIFNTELRRGKSGVIAVQNFRNVIEKLKVGPEQSRSALGDYLGEDWNKMKARFVTNENAYDTFKKKKIAEVIKPRIVNLLDNFEFQITGADETTRYNTEGLEALQALFPDTPKIFLEVLEDVDVSRDQFYDDFATDILNQNFTSPLEALNRLREFEASLGTTVTDEDTTELNTLKRMITTHLGKDSLALYRPRINELINQSKDILGGNNLADRWKSKTQSGKNIELKYYDATNKFNKAIIEIGKRNLDPETFAAEIEQAMVNYAADITRINNRKTTDSYVLNEGGVWSKAQEQLGIQLKEEEKLKPITVSQNTFETMQTNGEVEERDGKFYIKGSETLINVTEGTTAPVEEKKKEDNNVGFRERLKNLFVKPETKSSVDNNTNVIPASFTNTNAGEGGSQIPTEAGEDMDRQGGGVLKNNLKLMTDKFDKFNGAVSYGSSARGSNLEKDPNFITKIEKDGFSHAYADKSSKEVIDKAKEIYVDLVMNNTKENVEAKYAIAQMVLTEAILTSEEDMIGVMQSVLMRVARARLGIREFPFGAYSKDIITEMLRPSQYVGLADAGVKTKEQLLIKEPIKEDEETLKRVIDILWNVDPQGSKTII
tara:strand:+ start:207 stop:2849 length:2643 start_codon:yes stop_codon:yes gene_type:complete